ncbi:MAG: PTS fructose transporter subunit IIA [Deltaproteobacteria bacterium RBG_13_65_10]|jgi:PTS system nitrogen regulatory IIA component|nr:MAG: PTS fructose transporter subunit IIA [Deltaproteobacteria bacterium RBG_13_65_10]
MRLIDLMDKTAVIPDLKGREKREVLTEFAAAMAPSVGMKPEEIVRVLVDREKLGSTGIGDGVAIPHGKIAGLNGLHVGFARSTAGVDFEAMDGAPTHLFFILIAAEESVGEHLKTLARISRLLKESVLRARLMKVQTKEEILSVIEEEDAKQ